MGGGVAFLDFDADGLQDLFFVNGGETPRTKSLSSVRNALYRNIGNGKFEDVSAKAGVDRVEFYGMGVAVGDFDNDGFPDLYVSGFPSSALFHNNGNGTFTDVTARAGVKNAGRWAASAAWFDFDQDGYLDLVVTNYARFSFNEIKKCELNSVRSYCEQKSYPGMPLTLFRNNGNGTFMDVSEKSGVAKLVGRALGVVAIDVNDDGWPDLFVKTPRSRRNSPMTRTVLQRREWDATQVISIETVNQTSWLPISTTNTTLFSSALLPSCTATRPWPHDWLRIQKLMLVGERTSSIMTMMETWIC